MTEVRFLGAHGGQTQSAKTTCLQVSPTTVIDAGNLVAASCALKDRVVNISDIYQSQEFSFEGAKKFDEAMGYRSQSMLVIPLRDYEQRVIGVLQLLNRRNEQQETLAFGQEDEQIKLSLASQAAVALNNARLIDNLENLLETFLNSIIYTMGRKSAYTAGHINRMVALSEMIAAAVHKVTTVFADMQYRPEESQAIRIAALMHDIGKLATPETVMDKATELDVLEQLPFSDKYQDIPHVASAHHEKLNGQGYPLGLKGDEISFDARILAVTDIFEALTAFDRPYKKANPLSMAMKIMSFMVKDGELDPALVRFFYESGLYKAYAQRYLPDSSIDEVSMDFSGWPEG